MKQLLASICVMCALIMCLGNASADNISFSYQGRVKVQGQPFNGSGLFKFAILNPDSDAVLWSNDGTIGTGTGPKNLPVPSSAIAINTVDGVFSVMIGDDSIPGMSPLDTAVMVSDKPLRLRVWFSNGVLGFQELNPDTKLVDLTLTRIQTGVNDYTIYVNDESGNDANNGLTTATAKKTIQAAVDIIPDKIRCNIAISIAPGTYREQVTPHGISVAYGHTVTFIGDTSWTPTSVGSPSVVIDAADSGSTPVRDYCFYANQCTGIIIEGIAFQNSKLAGLSLEDGNYIVNRCLAKDNLVSVPRGFEPDASGLGFMAGPQCYIKFRQCVATNNGNFGFTVSSSSRGYLTSCTATINRIGVFATANSIAQFFDYNDFSNNQVGIQANSQSDVSVWPNSSPSNRTQIKNNGIGIVVNWSGQCSPGDAIISGNTKLYERYYGTIIGVDPQ